MDQKLINDCSLLIAKYKRLKNNKIKQSTRNEIFDKMFPFMMKWISSILADKKTFLPKQEIISYSWDCFCYCLEKYKVEIGIPIPNHFYTYCKYYLMEHLHDNDIKEITTESTMVGQELITPDSWFEVYSMKKEMKTFYDLLPSEYQEIFNDAWLSMSPRRSTRVRRANELHIPYYKYDTAKQVFKMVIKYILNVGT